MRTEVAAIPTRRFADAGLIGLACVVGGASQFSWSCAFWLYLHSPTPRGQIVVFKHPDDHTTDHINRVIGLPADRIQLRAGRLYINVTLVDRRPATDVAAGSQDETTHQLQFYQEFLADGANHLIAEESDDWTTPTCSLCLPITSSSWETIATIPWTAGSSALCTLICFGTSHSSFTGQPVPRESACRFDENL